MKKLLLAWCLFLLTTSCRGYLNPDDPDAKLVTDYFVDYWWELDISALWDMDLRASEHFLCL